MQQNSQFVWRSTAATAAARLHLAPSPGTDWGLLWYFFYFFFGSLLFFFFIEYCRKRPTNNHLQAAKLHNRPGRISFWVLLLLPLLLLGVILPLFAQRVTRTHRQTHARACTRTHRQQSGSQAGRQAGKLRQLQLQSEIRYHKAQGISQRQAGDQEEPR